MKNFKRGFTLIELLVVVAIIALLVSVVLVSLTDSKNKGNDAAIKTNLNNIKGAAELYYINPLTTSPTKEAFSFGGDSTGNCTIYDATSNVMFKRDKTIADAIVEAIKRSSLSYGFCDSYSNAWAVAVPLKSDSKSVWCVDSANTSKKITRVANGNIQFTDAIDSTTHLCK